MRKKTKDEFIQEAITIHGNKYDYSLVYYKNTASKVTIICPIHGEFEQVPFSHLAGVGCPFCGGKVKYTTSQFIEKAQLTHGTKYDYSLVEYVNDNTKVQIVCSTHGMFEQTPKGHTNSKQGCPICGKAKLRQSNILPLQTFIERSSSIHHNKYDYSQVSYDTLKDTIIIKCPYHGYFESQASLHIRGNGKCPQCERDFPIGKYTLTYFHNNPNIKDNDGLFYIVYFPTYNIIKIGITKHTVNKRYSGKGLNYKSLFEVKTTLFDAFCIEQDILSQFKQFRKSIQHMEGNTETFQPQIFGQLVEFVHSRLDKMERKAKS